MAKTKEKKKAIQLRRQGHSYNEICEKLGVAKSTCSVWLRAIKLNKKAIHRLVDKQDKGREKAALTLRQYKEERNEYIREKVKRSLNRVRLTPEISKLICAALYWAEGAKSESRLNFTNSDERMIQVFLDLLRRNFEVRESKFSATLHLHTYHDREKQLKYWSRITGIPSAKIGIYQKANTKKRTRPNYPGCISVRYHDVRIVKEIEYLYLTFAMQQIRSEND